jgi:hypothetical protein
MRNWRVYIVLAVIGIALAGGSCKTTGTGSPVPEAPPSPPPQEAPRPQPPAEAGPEQAAGPDQAALDALDQAKARAENARKRAADFDAPSYFPTEWEAAENDYQGIGADRSSAPAVEDAARRYNAAADAYDTIFNNAIPLYAKALEDEILRARAEAIAAGIEELAPEYLAVADDAAVNAEDRYHGEDYYGADAAAHEALDRYRALTAGSEGYQVREEIVRRDFAGFDADNFNQADAAFTAAADAYETGDAAGALKGAAESKRRYTQALRAGWAAYAAQLQALARRERQNALSEKANVAVKNEFAGVERTYNQAETFFKAEGYENAAGLYVKSEAGYVAVAQTAREKRRIAEAAIQAAEKKLAESEAVVRDAEVVLEGGEE